MSSAGRHNKLDDEFVDFIIVLVKASPTISVKEMNATLRASLNRKPSVSDATVSRAIDVWFMGKLCRGARQKERKQDACALTSCTDEA